MTGRPLSGRPLGGRPLAFGDGQNASGKGVGFSLDAYLSTLSKAFRFNLRKTDRFFQESTGITLADDVGETIGLALDQATWGGRTLADRVAAQPELVSNGSFGTDATGWTPNANVSQTVESGRFKVTATGGAVFTSSQSLSGLVSGRVYRQVSTVESPVGNSAVRARVRFDAAPDVEASSAGVPKTQTIFKVYTATNNAVTVDVASTSAFGIVGDIAYADDISLKYISSTYGRQTGSSTLRPIRQAEGAKFDGTDDNWLMGYLAAAGSNFLMARTTVPVTLAGTQVIAGASGASANRFFVGVNTSGFACGGVGSDSTSTIVGTTDLRGTEADIALSCDGATVRLIVNGVIEYEAAQNSTPTTTIPFRVGAYNNNGTGGSYYAGAIEECLAGTEFLTLARFNQIAASIAANE